MAKVFIPVMFELPQPSTNFGAMKSEIAELRRELKVIQDQMPQLLETSAAVILLRQEVSDLKDERPQLIHDQLQYSKILYREIVVIVRDLLALDGGQVGRNFRAFSNALPEQFLIDRNLTWDAINLINGVTIRDDDGVADRPTLVELRHGLDGLTGAKLEGMTLLYNFIVSRTVE